MLSVIKSLPSQLRVLPAMLSLGVQTNLFAPQQQLKTPQNLSELHQTQVVQVADNQVAPVVKEPEDPSKIDNDAIVMKYLDHLAPHGSDENDDDLKATVKFLIDQAENKTLALHTIIGGANSNYITPELVAYAVQQGADPITRDDNGDTALDTVIRYRHNEDLRPVMAEALKKLGVPETKDGYIFEKIDEAYNTGDVQAFTQAVKSLKAVKLPIDIDAALTRRYLNTISLIGIDANKAGDLDLKKEFVEALFTELDESSRTAAFRKLVLSTPNDITIPMMQAAIDLGADPAAKGPDNSTILDAISITKYDNEKREMVIGFLESLGVERNTTALAGEIAKELDLDTYLQKTGIEKAFDSGDGVVFRTKLSALLEEANGNKDQSLNKNG